MEIRILGHGYPRAEASEATGNRKPKVEANVCGVELGSQDTEGHYLKKAVKPDMRWKNIPNQMTPPAYLNMRIIPA